MESRSQFEVSRGDLAESIPVHGIWRRLVFIAHGRCWCRRRDGLSCFEAPLVLAAPGTAAPSTRMEAARGVSLSFAQRLADDLAFRLGGDDASLLTAQAPVFVRLPRPETAACRGLFDDIAEAWETRRNGNLEIVLVKTVGLLVLLRRFTAGPTRADRVGSAADASCIEEYLKTRFRESLSLETMADELGYSPSYLSRYFKRRTGRCLFEYLNSRRIAEACSLLKTTDKTVTEIAFEVGYNNLSFFNRYFRKLMDASPLEFRKRAR